MTARPPWIANVADLEEQEAHYPPPFEGEKLTHGRDIGAAVGTVGLGAWQERLPPGRRTSFTHAHSKSDELIYVLSGNPHVRVIPPGGEAEEHALGPGDVVSFPGGTGIAHTFVNHSDADAVLLVVSDRPDDDRVRYPEDPVFDAHHADIRARRHWFVE